MKSTTQQIYNLITNSNFENIKQKLMDKVEQQHWQIPERQEYTYDKAFGYNKHSQKSEFNQMKIL